MAGMTCAGSRAGEASSPSITNRPIWASQATPSAKPRMAGPCGSRVLPSTSAETYTARRPLARASVAAP